MTEPGGYCRIHRKVYENPTFRSPAEALAFVYMVTQAAWRPVKVRYKERTIELQRGQLAISVRDFARRMERSPDWAKRFLERLSTARLIRHSAATGVNVITICKYDKFQLSPAPAATLPPQDRHSAATQNKEGKEDKESSIEDSNAGVSASAHGFRVPQPQWTDFVEFRKKIGKALTPHACNLAIAKLERFAKAGDNPAEVLEQSILNGWSGLFRVKEESNHNGKRRGDHRAESADELADPVLRDHFRRFGSGMGA